LRTPRRADLATADHGEASVGSCYVASGHEVRFLLRPQHGQAGSAGGVSDSLTGAEQP
jgi:hypothetical protein